MVGIGVVLELMDFGFFGLRVGQVMGILGPLRDRVPDDYATLSAALVAFGVSLLICYAMSVRSSERFDFALTRQRTGDFDPEPATADEAWPDDVLSEQLDQTESHDDDRQGATKEAP